MRERFIVTDTVPHDFCRAIEAAGFDVDYIPVLYNEGLAPVIHTYDGIVVSSQVSLDKPMLDKATKLKYILRPGSGLDNIDVEAARQKGILVLNSPEANSDAVGEHAIALLLGLMNHIPRSFEAIKQMQWVRHPNTGVQLKGKTVGIIGYGHNGSAFAEKLRGFEVNILIYDKYKTGFAPAYARECGMEEIKATADVLSLHIPLNEETRALVDLAYINSFAREFYFINTSRGGIVRSQDVATALKSGKLLGAGLDVLENERLEKYTEAEKDQLQQLLASGNIILTPHIAGWTKEARREIFFKVLSKFEAWIKEGKPARR